MTPEEFNRQRRDAELERSSHRPMVADFATKVVGVSFAPTYPDNLHALDEAQRNAIATGEPLVAILRRNPANQFDANAVEVHVPALGSELGMIGHLTRPIAARLAPDMDAGGRWVAHVESVLIDPDHPDRPGVSILCAKHATEEGA